GGFARVQHDVTRKSYTGAVKIIGPYTETVAFLIFHAEVIIAFAVKGAAPPGLFLIGIRGIFGLESPARVDLPFHTGEGGCRPAEPLVPVRATALPDRGDRTITKDRADAA